MIAMQENNNSSETNTSPSLKKKNLFVFLKTLPFIGGLVVSYIFVEFSVVLMDYLTDSRDYNQRAAAVVTNLQDGLSSIIFVVVSNISVVYTGYLTMITFCVAASIEGLMLLWTSTSTSADVVVYAAIFLLAFGKSGQNLLENFLKHQLLEKSKEKNEQDHEGTIRTNIWLFASSIVGFIITGYMASEVHDETYEDSFRFGAILMGGTHMLFLFGCKWYKELTIESNLCQIYRICKAAFGKRDSKYPTSPSSYYWRDYKKNHFYDQQGEGLRLSPRVPWLFRWLDKAAIVNSEEGLSHETQETKGKLCVVKEVREVKSLVPMIYLGFTFVAFSLLVTTGNIFFVTQASNMTSNITIDGNDIPILLLIKMGMKRISQFICFIIRFAFQRLRKLKDSDGISKSKRKAAAIIRIGFGLIFAIICCLVAWHVEVRRLKVHKVYLERTSNSTRNSTSNSTRNSTRALIPQFSLLGVTEGLVEGGLASLFQGHVANSMRSFEDSFSEMVIGTGKFLVIPFVFSNWIKETFNASRLDNYYFMLGILNVVFLVGFAYYSIRYAYMEEYSEDEKMDQTLEPDSDDSSAENDNEAPQLEDQLVGSPPEEDVKIMVEQTLEDHQQNSQDCNSEIDNNEAHQEMFITTNEEQYEENDANVAVLSILFSG